MKGVHWIDLGQWPQHLALIADKAAYRRFMRAYSADADWPAYPVPNGGHCQKMTQKSGACMFVIVLGPQSNLHETFYSLTHEATHAMRWILEHVGEHRPGIETEAYLVEHIVRRCLKALA